MKFVSYNTSADEKQYFEEFGARFGVEYVLVDKPLDEETVELAEGCVGVTDFLHNGYSEEVLAKLQKFGVEYISRRTVGYDGIDFGLLEKYGLRLANVPAYSPAAIAELTVALALALLRHLEVVFSLVKTQDYSRVETMGKELGKQTVGIIGTGHIGFAAAQIFKGFGCEVLAYDVRQRRDSAGVLEYRGTLGEVLAEADIISLHVPLLDDNYHMINAETITGMKDGAYIINTARGELIDSQALLEALMSKKLAGAGLDVYEFASGQEIFGQGMENQIIDDPTFLMLSGLPNVVVTPHTAYNTDVAVGNMVEMATKNLVDFVHTGHCKNEVTG
jgi:D-lactate dehydrogenase